MFSFMNFFNFFFEFMVLRLNKSYIICKSWSLFCCAKAKKTTSFNHVREKKLKTFLWWWSTKKVHWCSLKLIFSVFLFNEIYKWVQFIRKLSNFFLFFCCLACLRTSLGLFWKVIKVYDQIFFFNFSSEKFFCKLSFFAIFVCFMLILKDVSR